LDYLTPEVEVGVLNQSGGKRLRKNLPQSLALAGVPDIQFEVVFEMIHPMSAWYMIVKPSQKFEFAYRKYIFEGVCVFFSWKNSAVLIFLGFTALGALRP
jgi:hypothetical protein